LEADETKLLQRLLPWLILSEKFARHSVQESKGPTNPYIGQAAPAWASRCSVNAAFLFTGLRMLVVV